MQALTAVSAGFQAFSELCTTLTVTVVTEVLFAIVAHGDRFYEVAVFFCYSTAELPELLQGRSRTSDPQCKRGVK